MQRLGLIGIFLALTLIASTACTNRPEKAQCDQACEKVLDNALKKKLKLARILPDEEYDAVKDKLEQQKEDLVGKCSSECVVKATKAACECFIKAEKKSEIELCAKQYKNVDSELAEEDIPDDSIKDDKLEDDGKKKVSDDDDDDEVEKKSDDKDDDKAEEKKDDEKKDEKKDDEKKDDEAKESDG